MNNAIKITGTIDELSNIAENIQGAEISTFTHTDYSMLKINCGSDNDIIIFDLRSAVGEGMRALGSAKMSLNKPYVIVISGLNNEDFRKRCYKLGADFFFDKNDGISELNLFLNQHLNSNKKTEAKDMKYV